MNPYPTPPSFLPIEQGLPQGNPSVIPTSPYQHAVPAQRVQHDLLGHSHINTDSSLDVSRVPSLDQQHAGLNFARSRGISTTSQDLRSSVFGTQGLEPPRPSDPYRVPSNNPRSSAALLDGSPSFHTDHTIRDTSISHFDPLPYVDQPGLVSSYGHSPLATAPNDHLHWCVVCDHPGEIGTCDGFKRHMREHETRFYCMLQGPVVDTENGPKCAFCNVLHPDPEHLGTHKIQLCVDKSPADRSYSRKNLLTNHLKYHKVVEVVEASILADQWRNTVDKKYFACGFCGSYFDSHVEQTNHIDVMHYRLSEHIKNWDSNKVIRGLLSQPGVRDSWRELLATNPCLQESSLTWEPARAKNLQLRLERSEETAEVLSIAAIDQSNYSRSDLGFAGLQMGTSQSMQTLQNRPVWSPLRSTLDHDSITHAQTLPSTNLGQQSQHSARHQTIENNPDSIGVYGSRPVLESTSRTYGSYTSTYQHHSGSPTEIRSQPSSGGNFMQLPLSFHAPSSAQSWASRPGPTYNSGFGGFSPVVSPSLTNCTYPRQGAEASTIPVQVPTQSFDPTLAAEQFARPHEQQSEGYNKYGLDDSSNSNMQRIVQDNADTRRRRRPH